MNNKKFTREILRLLPGFKGVERNFFYETPFKHILAGFAWDRPGIYVYVLKYAYPLYEGVDFLHFGYGGRLPKSESAIPIVKGEEQTMAEEFVRRITPYREEISQLRDLNNFLSYIESRQKALENPSIRRGLALTLLMAGQKGQAIEQLEQCLPDPSKPEFEANIREWIEAIRDGSATEKLHASEECAKRRLGIE